MALVHVNVKQFWKEVIGKSFRFGFRFTEEPIDRPYFD